MVIPARSAAVVSAAPSTRIVLPASIASTRARAAASVAALTVYDMTKALDKGIEIQDVYLVEKTGGKSGLWRRVKPKAKR